MKDGTSKECCFDNHEITTENIVFEHGEDPVSAVQQIFVRKEHCRCHYGCQLLHNDNAVHIFLQPKGVCCSQNTDYDPIIVS